jgi:RNA ligase
MFYDFPSELSLEEVKSVVEQHNARTGTTAFIEADRGDHVVFNYVVAFEGSFPQPDTGDQALDRQFAILRECRGLIMCKNSGRVLARRYHKFFNVNEKPFTQAHLVDWNQPHLVLEKLDGSMITPFLSDSRLRWGTKMGLTDVALPVEVFIAENPKYVDYAISELTNGRTPLFEWCSRKQKIVIDYPEDMLILTAVRDNAKGSYASHDELCRLGKHFDIPVVRALPGSIESIETFMAEARDLEGAEGYVIRFNNGHMLKVKGAWYCQIHSTKDLLQHEKDVWALILEERMDDAMAFMDDADRDRVTRYVNDLEAEIALTAERLRSYVEMKRIDLDGDKKRFAIEAIPTQPSEHRALLFAMWDRVGPVEVVRKFLSKNMSTRTKVEAARWAVNGLSWDNYRDRGVQLDD